MNDSLSTNTESEVGTTTDLTLPGSIVADPNQLTHPTHEISAESSSASFIEANTIPARLDEIQNEHVIPVFVKDNEPAISQADFIETTYQAITEIYPNDRVLTPSIRLSHPIKGRTPDAKFKPASQLEEWEKTLYYERMMFIFEIPTIQDEVDGNLLSLTVGGVKSYNQDNLYNKKGADEHFEVFVGFKNKVCSNLCVWTDGYLGDLKVTSVGQLKGAIKTLLETYNAVYHLAQLRAMTERQLTERQFAHFLGRCRMYQYLPIKHRDGITPLLLGDQQISAVCRDFYTDKNFSGDLNDRSISLWQLYNLFTAANKSTYIDQFLNRSVGAFQLVEEIRFAMDGKRTSWYLS